MRFFALSDLESTFRIVALAYTRGKKREALGLLERAAGERTEAVINAKSRPKPSPGSLRDLAALYSWMVTAVQSGRLDCEARALRHVLRELRQT